MENIAKLTTEEIIRENIDKANYLIDIALSNIKEDNLTSRMIEAISKLIDSVTTAANTLITSENDIFNLQIKTDMLELKKRELDLKSVISGTQKNQNNIFVGSFKELMKQINNQTTEQIVYEKYKGEGSDQQQQ